MSTKANSSAKGVHHHKMCLKFICTLRVVKIPNFRYLSGPSRRNYRSSIQASSSSSAGKFEGTESGTEINYPPHLRSRASRRLSVSNRPSDIFASRLHLENNAWYCRTLDICMRWFLEASEHEDALFSACTFHSLKTVFLRPWMRPSSPSFLLWNAYELQYKNEIWFFVTANDCGANLNDYKCACCICVHVWVVSRQRRKNHLNPDNFRPAPLRFNGRKGKRQKVELQYYRCNQDQWI